MGYISYTRTTVPKHINYTFNDNNTTINSYLKLSNTVSNESSYILPCNSILNYITVNTRSNETCTFYVRKNNISVDIVGISLIGENLKSIITNTQFYANDKIEVFCSGSSKKTTVTLYFETSC